MKLDERFNLDIVIIEDKGNGIPGDCYNDYEEFRKDHPSSGYMFGYAITEEISGLIPEFCNGWNDTPEDAFLEWKEKCEGDEVLFKYVNNSRVSKDSFVSCIWNDKGISVFLNYTGKENDRRKLFSGSYEACQSQNETSIEIWARAMRLAEKASEHFGLKLYTEKKFFGK